MLPETVGKYLIFHKLDLEIHSTFHLRPSKSGIHRLVQIKGCIDSLRLIEGPSKKLQKLCIISCLLITCYKPT